MKDVYPKDAAEIILKRQAAAACDSNPIQTAEIANRFTTKPLY